ncbi:penicillin-binding transpeptidase domain-containing protein [Hellea sp.]|nr:penicillin-binding transpeptidase domain-containing protein [Hellea sp.]
MRKLFPLAVILSLVFWALTACKSSETSVDFDAILAAQGIDPARATLLIVRLETGQSWSHNEARADRRYVAASTSKISHTFIALESGYVAGPQTLFKWDGQERWSKGWNQDLTFAQAYARSAVWVFQDITRALGPEKMAEGLKIFEYGNQDIGGPADITTYWLTGPLKISAREQVQFLTKLHNETFPLSPKTYLAGKEIMKAGRDDGRFAKTGWYYSDEEPDIGWYVGWHEAEGTTEPETYVFAFNMDMDDRDKDPPKRAAAVNAALSALKVSAERK